MQDKKQSHMISQPQLAHIKYDLGTCAACSKTPCWQASAKSLLCFSFAEANAFAETKQVGREGRTREV